jgi:type IV pilus assembly protein PilB
MLTAQSDNQQNQGQNQSVAEPTVTVPPVNAVGSQKNQSPNTISPQVEQVQVASPATASFDPTTQQTPVVAPSTQVVPMTSTNDLSNDPSSVVTPIRTQPDPIVETAPVNPADATKTLEPVSNQDTQVNIPVNTPPVTTTSTDAVSTPTTVPTNTATAPTLSHNFIPTNTFFDTVVKNKSIPADQAEALKQETLSSGKSYEELLQSKNLANETEITQAKAEFNKLQYIQLSSTGADPEALNLIDEVIAKRYTVLPFALDRESDVVKVAMLNPMDLSAIEFLKQKTGHNVEAYFAEPSEINRMIADRYSQNLSSEVTEALKTTNQYQTQVEGGVNINKSGQILRDAPINRIVENLMDFAMQARASDIHIEPQINRVRVRYRIDGILAEKLILPKNVHEAVVSRIKIMANLKIDEKRLPQDGRFNFKSQGKEIDLRISTLPTVHGEKVVMRLLEKNTAVPSLQDLGLTGLALKRVLDAIKVPHGIILVTGPTGSGKTTTLYSILHLINNVGVNIMTLEDPVEYQMPGVSQVQVNPKAGLTFASGLRSFLRQDPDIIMVGEIRDNETADLALQASLTGHLVFSTLHTNSAAGALPRLLDMEAEPFLLSSSVLAVLGQRVVRRINPQYKEEYKPEPAVLEDIKRVLGNHFLNWCKEKNKDPNNITLFRPSKNRPNTEPEFKGRVGIYEVMPTSQEISKLILERSSSDNIEQIAQQQSMLLMKQDGYLKVLEGVTTIEEVLRVAEVS